MTDKRDKFALAKDNQVSFLSVRNRLKEILIMLGSKMNEFNKDMIGFLNM